MHGDTRHVLFSVMTKHFCYKGGHGTHLVKHLYLINYMLRHNVGLKLFLSVVKRYAEILSQLAI